MDSSGLYGALYILGGGVFPGLRGPRRNVSSLVPCKGVVTLLLLVLGRLLLLLLCSSWVLARRVKMRWSLKLELYLWVEMSFDPLPLGSRRCWDVRGRLPALPPI